MIQPLNDPQNGFQLPQNQPPLTFRGRMIRACSALNKQDLLIKSLMLIILLITVGGAFLFYENKNPRSRTAAITLTMIIDFCLVLSIVGLQLRKTCRPLPSPMTGN